MCSACSTNKSAQLNEAGPQWMNSTWVPSGYTHVRLDSDQFSVGFSWNNGTTHTHTFSHTYYTYLQAEAIRRGMRGRGRNICCMRPSLGKWNVIECILNLFSRWVRSESALNSTRDATNHSPRAERKRWRMWGTCCIVLCATEKWNHKKVHKSIVN